MRIIKRSFKKKSLRWRSRSRLTWTNRRAPAAVPRLSEPQWNAHRGARAPLRVRRRVPAPASCVTRSLRLPSITDASRIRCENPAVLHRQRLEITANSSRHELQRRLPSSSRQTGSCPPPTSSILMTAVSNGNLNEVEGGESWELTLWNSGGTQQSRALPWGGAPPHLQTGRGGWLVQVGLWGQPQWYWCQRLTTNCSYFLVLMPWKNK